MEMETRRGWFGSFLTILGSRFTPQHRQWYLLSMLAVLAVAVVGVMVGVTLMMS